MDPAPKRSLGETIGQLIVIAVLIGILIGALILFRQYVDSHNASNSPPPPNSTKARFTFNCCTAFHSNVVYRPGEIVRLAWTPVEAAPGASPSRTVTLSASLSKSYPSVQDLKSSAKSGAFKITSGPYIAATGPLTVSNRSGATPVLGLRIPANARTGFYNLVTTTSQKEDSVSGASIIEIRR